MGLERRPFYRVERVSQGKRPQDLFLSGQGRGRTNGLMESKRNSGSWVFFYILGFLVLGSAEAFGDGNAPLTPLHILWSPLLRAYHTYLPIIYNITEVKITESYHKFLGLTRIRHCMAVS